MKRSIAVTLLCGLCLLASLPVAGQEERTAASPRKLTEPDEATRRWLAAVSPGEHHRLLDRFIGIWNVTTRAWSRGPDAEPVETEGIATYEWILKGHYVLEETRGEQMGFPHEGMGITGYDNLKKEYVGMWVDNLSTAIYTMSGTLDSTGTTLTMTGLGDDPASGRIEIRVRYVTRFIDDDRFVFGIYDASSGEDVQIAEMTYTRK